uniref:ISL3 family transposase n=1 Tax=Lichenicola cladoniae TaxID=1484109 RepID=UPI0038D118A6
MIPVGLSVLQVIPGPDLVTIITAPKSVQSPCPLCCIQSGQIHSRYRRTLADLPWQGRTVVVELHARRFRCVTTDCPRRIFTERLPNVVCPSARRTARLESIQRHIGFALGGEAGARLAGRLAMPISGDTLLRLIRATYLEQQPSPRVVGIDDWAWRRGKRYGTIICDLERRRVIDILPERSAEVVASWLHQHPGVEVIARDRAGAYAEGARQGAPAAIQVADRWHLLRNLGDTLQAAVDRNRGAVRQAAKAVVQGESSAPEETMLSPYSTSASRQRAERQGQRQARFKELRRLHSSGLSAEAIAPALGMSAIVVRRWLKASGPPAHSKPRQPQPLDVHIPVLEDRWREGCRNASRLWRELRQGGFTGSRGPVARWVARRRHEDPSPYAAEVRRAAAWPVPSSRRCARWLTTPSDKLSDQEGIFISQLAGLAPGLSQAGELATGFAALMQKRSKADPTKEFKNWLAGARGTELDAFVRGIDRDHGAVLAALTEPWSTSPVEGQINRLKVLKRTMYGRAGYDLLRRRVLIAA